MISLICGDLETKQTNQKENKTHRYKNKRKVVRGGGWEEAK